jgi:uncharacterized protein (DUF1778 family)
LPYRRGIAVARTARIELRAEPEREQRIRYAAKLAGQSLTDFMLEPASERAEEVITSAHVTVVPADFFDALWEALDEAPQPNARLARAFKEARKRPRLRSVELRLRGAR